MSSEEDQFNYEIVDDSSATRKFSEKEIEKLQNEGLEFDSKPDDDDDEISELIKESDDEKKLYYKNMICSPYPIIDGIFSNLCSFKERTKFMETVEEDKVFKIITRPGSGKKVTRNDAVMFHMNAFIFEVYDEPFDSTFARKKPLLCRLNQILPGLSMSLFTMQEGERAEFAVHRSLAYGELGCPPRIPSGSDIIFIVELLQIYPKGTIQYYHSLTAAEQQEEGLSINQVVSLAEQERNQGNEHFRLEKYQKAIHFYRRAINLLEKLFISHKDKKLFNNLLLKLYQNTASAHIRLSNGAQIVHYARRAQRINENSIKTNYQLGMGYLKLGKFESAKKYLLKAHQTLPNDENINKALELLNHKLTIYQMESKDLYKKMSQAILL